MHVDLPELSLGANRELAAPVAVLDDMVNHQRCDVGLRERVKPCACELLGVEALPVIEVGERVASDRGIENDERDARVEDVIQVRRGRRR